jgi:hypothetical protein
MRIGFEKVETKVLYDIYDICDRCVMSNEINNSIIFDIFDKAGKYNFDLQRQVFLIMI